MSFYYFVRDSFWGRTIYHLSGHRLFTYKEEQQSYVIPEKYLIGIRVQKKDTSSSNGELEEFLDCSTEMNQKQTLQPIIVSWDGNNDPENPKNWPILLKVVFVAQIGFLTISVYMASAIYTPGIESLINDLQISRLKATLPLTMFVIGYGIGPMVCSPLSENAAFGRTTIYIITLFIFFILQIPTALSKDITSLTILRFISGFFGSPALATGGASVGDISAPAYLPLVIAIWSIAAVSGPSMGPLFGAIMTVKRGWRWTFWFVCMVSGICFVILSLFLPETYEKTLLLRKAKRLRKVTGNPNIISSSEIETKGLTAQKILIKTLWRPIEISLFEPIVLAIDLYIALVYSVLYLWFEAFPIVFVDTYHFDLIPYGATFLSIIVGVLIGSFAYILYLYESYTKKILNGVSVTPEIFLRIMIVAAIFMPIGIFIFGWASSSHLFWFGPLVGSSVFGIGFFIIFQTGFNYLGSSFIDYIASVFAGNNLFRSVIAGCFPLFAYPMFNNLSTKNYPVGWGCSILGFIALVMIMIPVFFYLNGPRMRARSKYSTFALDN